VIIIGVGQLVVLREMLEQAGSPGEIEAVADDVRPGIGHGLHSRRSPVTRARSQMPIRFASISYAFPFASVYARSLEEGLNDRGAARLVIGAHDVVGELQYRPSPVRR